MLQMSKIAGHEFFAKMRSRRRSLYVMLFASTFPAGAIVVFIPWGRGAEAAGGAYSRSDRAGEVLSLVMPRRGSLPSACRVSGWCR